MALNCKQLERVRSNFDHFKFWRLYHSVFIDQQFASVFQIYKSNFFLYKFFKSIQNIPLNYAAI